MQSYAQKSSESILYRQVVVGDTIVDALWTIAPSAAVSRISKSNKDTTAMVSGLTYGTTYVLTVTCRTLSGQILQRNALIRCIGPIVGTDGGITWGDADGGMTWGGDGPNGEMNWGGG